MRSRSLLILSAPTRKRRSTATGMLQGEQVDRLILDLHLHPVDLFVGA
jgi:hypothetical protein